MASLSDYAMIANSVKDDVLTPNETGIQNQQLKSMALGNQGKEMQLGQAKKSMDQQALLQQVLQKNTVTDQSGVKTNHAQVAADLANAGYVDQAYEYMNKQRLTDYEKHRQQIGQIASIAQGVMSLPPEARPAAYKSAIQRASEFVDTSGAPPDYDENFLTQIINSAVEAETYYKAQNGGTKGNEFVFLSTPKGYVAANKGNKETSILKDEAGNPYLPSNIDIDAQSRLAAGKREAVAAVDLKSRPEIEKAVATAKEEAKAAATKLNKERAQLTRLEDLDTIYSNMSNANLDLIYGAGEKWYPEIIRSQTGIDLIADRDQLLGMLQLAERGELKGQGPVTDSDATVISQAVSTLSNPNISPEKAKKALDAARERIYKGAGKGGSGEGAATTGINGPSVSNW
jgi:hypothetical protein